MKFPNYLVSILLLREVKGMTFKQDASCQPFPFFYGPGPRFVGPGCPIDISRLACDVSNYIPKIPLFPDDPQNTLIEVIN